MLGSVDANLDNIKKLEGDRIQDCDGSFGLSHVDKISSLVIQGDCCHHAVIGCWLAVLALTLCRHELVVTVMQQRQGMGKSACTMSAEAHSVRMKTWPNMLCRSRKCAGMCSDMLVCAQTCWYVLRHAGMCSDMPKLAIPAACSSSSCMWGADGCVGSSTAAKADARNLQQDPFAMTAADEGAEHIGWRRCMRLPSSLLLAVGCMFTEKRKMRVCLTHNHSW